MSEQVERSTSEMPVEEQEEGLASAVTAVEPDPEARERIREHIAAYVGPPSQVYHEIVSELVHVDIHIVEPTEERNYYTLVTAGMSDQAMDPPSGFEAFEHAELLICLPPSWELSKEAFEEEENYWPVRWLKILARLPHRLQIWLWATHSVPNGRPPQPYAANTAFCCMLLMVPVLFDDAFLQLEVDEEKTIHFLSLVPLYEEEMAFKLERGIQQLLPLLEEAGVNELLDLERENTCLDEED